MKWCVKVNRWSCSNFLWYSCDMNVTLKCSYPSLLHQTSPLVTFPSSRLVSRPHIVLHVFPRGWLSHIALFHMLICSRDDLLWQAHTVPEPPPSCSAPSTFRAVKLSVKIHLYLPSTLRILLACLSSIIYLFLSFLLPAVGGKLWGNKTIHLNVTWFLGVWISWAPKSRSPEWILTLGRWWHFIAYYSMTATSYLSTCHKYHNEMVCYEAWHTDITCYSGSESRSERGYRTTDGAVVHTMLTVLEFEANVSVVDLIT